MGKPGPPHREHKHPPPVGPGSVRVTQARDAVRWEQSYAREGAKRDRNNQHGVEHIFSPPVRNSEPKERLLQTQGEHVSSQHHGLPSDSVLPVTNHLGGSMNSGVNCNVSCRKDNQGLDWTDGEKISDVDSRRVIEKSNVSGSMKNADNRYLVPLHMESSSKRSQQQRFESSSRHGHRASATGSGEIRTLKEDLPSKMVSDTSDSQRDLYNHNKHGTSDRLDHGRHRKASEQFTSRQFQPPIEGIIDRKRPSILDVKHQPVQPFQSMKREPKPDLNTVKKEDSMNFSSRVGGSSVQPPPLPPPTAAQTPLLPNAVVLPPLHHPQERQKSRPRSPCQVHEKPQSQHQRHARSSAPAREKSPLSAAIRVQATVCKKSESPHHGRAKPTTLPGPNTSTPSRNGTGITEMKPAVEARSRHPEAHAAKPVLAVDQPSVTVKSETEMMQQTSLKVSSVNQKAGNVALLPSTPEKAGISSSGVSISSIQQI